MLADVGGKFQSIIVLIKGLVREPFMPVQRFGDRQRTFLAC